MSSAILAVGAPSIQRPGAFRQAGDVLSEIFHDPGAAAAGVEGAIFDRYDTAVENKLGIGTPSSELTMSLPRMAWRLLAGAGAVAAGIALL